LERALNKSFGSFLFGDAVRVIPGILAQLLGGFGISIILGRYFEPASMAIYTLYWLGQNYAMIFLSGWLQNAAIRYLPNSVTYLGGYLKLHLIVLSVAFLLGISVSLLLSAALGDVYQLKHLLITTFLLCGTISCFVFQSIFRGIFDQIWFSLSAFIVVFVQIGLLLLLLPMSQDKVTMALGSMAAGFLVVDIGLWRMLIRKSARLDMSERLENELKNLFKVSFQYGMPLTISLFIITFLQTGDRYLLACLVDLKLLGIYAFWMTIGMQVGRGLYGIIFAVINPRLFQSHKSDPEKARQYVKKMISLYTVILPPLLIIFGLMLPWLLALLKVKQEYCSESFLIFFGIGMAFCLGLAQLCGKHFEFSEKTMVFVLASVIGALVMVVGVFALTPVWGIKGSALSSCAGFVAYLVSVAVMARTWPKFLDILLASIAVAILLVIYKMIFGFLGPTLTWSFVIFLLAFYCIINFRLRI
jgi:O-antigen/teichoic acid export membrane protein